MERSGIDLARLLLKKAAGDQTALRELLTAKDVPDAILGFHAQQAVEKSIKAALATHDVPYERTHNIAYLRSLVVESHGIDVPANIAEADFLSPWAVEFRYDAPVDEEPLDRNKTLDLVVSVVEWANSIVEP